MNRHPSTWFVRPSRFPFGVASQILGEVTAVDRRAALQRAEELYGRDVVVELAHSGVNSPERTRHNGRSDSIRRPVSILGSSPIRPMTPDEMAMARALSSCPKLRGSKYRPAIRAIHASTFTASPTISEELAALLRAGVRAMGEHLDPSIVRLAGGAS